MNRDIACSHIKAYSYFLETLVRSAGNSKGCQFYAWNCPRGPDDFYYGRCFPSKSTGAILSGRMGDNSFGQGPMYLMTRKEQPFCGNYQKKKYIMRKNYHVVLSGTPIQIETHISSETKPTRGVLNITLHYNNSTTPLSVNCE